MARSSNPTTSRAKPKLQTDDLMTELKQQAENPQADVEPLANEAEAVVEKPKRARKPKAAAAATVEPPKEKKIREVGPATQKVIDRILQLRREGKGLPTIAKILNDDKVPTLKGGATWYAPVVRGICLRYGVEKGEKAES